MSIMWILWYACSRTHWQYVTLTSLSFVNHIIMAMVKEDETFCQDKFQTKLAQMKTPKYSCFFIQYRQITTWSFANKNYFCHFALNFARTLQKWKCTIEYIKCTLAESVFVVAAKAACHKFLHSLLLLFDTRLERITVNIKQQLTAIFSFGFPFILSLSRRTKTFAAQTYCAGEATGGGVNKVFVIWYKNKCTSAWSGSLSTIGLFE